MKPNTNYIKSGHVNIAYQVFGSGTVDLVYIPGWISNIDYMWACPELVSFLQELGKIARVILFDKRGTGLSDRIATYPTLEERMDDIRAVMDAVGSKKAVLFGHSEGGSVSALFAATYPERTISLVSFGIFAKRVYSSDYPWAPTNEERQEVYDMIENNWGSGDMNLEALAPSKANDKNFMDWLASYFRSGASPGAAMMLTKLNTQIDIIDILGSINVPTLILQRTHDIDVKIEEGRFIAERISGAKFVELEGNDHLFWVGDTERVLQEIRTFVFDVKPKPVYEKKLYTFMVGHISTPIKRDNKLHKLIRECVARYGGNVAIYDNDTFTLTFEGPSTAVYCSSELMKIVKSVNAHISIGVDIKECSIKDCICEETEDFVTLVTKQSAPNQIIVTQTVKNLLIGVNMSFVPYQTIFKTELGASLLLYKATKNLPTDVTLIDKNKSPQQDSLLQKVIQNINHHLSNDYYGVTMLCTEVGVSERQLQRKLKASTNMSPNQLISSIRLNRAKELIIGRQNTIAEIAFQTGFSSPSYFSKRFKKQFAISPSELVS
ncbi:alpha/beta fold hydrolase [Aquimarina sp. AD1]|uniref:alpha/beta fold hydrolase n=1 Tax=Aquimarina sp. (strain AD1) TaxID=1714848 RepID=UPI000E4B0627|nr:alpha/beta fold hydrolase [Aquimarina sp. AD1]AXT57925.1 alpha/beta fold hydrolase [Aquimarina sp. AD1]RKN15160.1 alpha/beta fold hydrolase [Aquimarina sp. AD1]